MLTLWFCSLLDFQTRICYLIKDCICCCHSLPTSWPVRASRAEWMFFPPVALIKMVLSGCTTVEQQLCWGTEGLFKLCLPVFISLKWEIKPKHINQRTTVMESEWLFWIQPFSLVPQHSMWSCSPERLNTRTLVYEDSMMNGNTHSSAHQWTQFLWKWPWTGCCRHSVKQRHSRDSTSPLAFYTVLLSGDAKPQLYAFQYIYCNYCQNLNTNLRAETQFGLFCPHVLFFYFLSANFSKVGLLSQTKAQEL